MAQGRKTTGTAKKHRASDVKPTPPKVFGFTRGYDQYFIPLCIT